MRKILIPTDFSENANNAIEFAVNLFKYDVSEFYIMHVYQDDIYANELALTKANLNKAKAVAKKNSENALDKIVKNITAFSPNPRHTLHTISANNLLIEEADDIVDEQNIDLIIMGTKGKTNNKKITFGSNTLQVLKYVQCPVLAIPENYKYTQPKNILFPTNYVIPFKRRELKLLCEIASPYRAIIDVLYISESEKLSMRQGDNQTFLKEILYQNKINFRIEKSKHIINTIYKYIKANHVDMLVMVNTRHSFLENILFQSTTIDELSLNLDIPFLVLQNMKRSNV
jgi:nucleotide-binding universal stress UspA family protein